MVILRFRYSAVALAVALFCFYQNDCWAGVKNIRVSPDSAMGQAIQRMDEEARNAQNAAVLSKALSDYASDQSQTCTNIVFQAVREPGLKINRYVQLYTIDAKATNGMEQVYHARITFKDAPHTIAKKVEVLLGPNDEVAFRAKAKQFIEYAKAGDVEQMLAMTSSRSHATQTTSLRALYADQVVPAFKDTTVEWQEDADPCVDERKNTGLEFIGQTKDEKPFSFSVAVYRENGNVVIANIERNPRKRASRKESYE